MSPRKLHSVTATIIVVLCISSGSIGATPLSIGTPAPAFTVMNQHYEAQGLSDYGEHKAWVLIFLSNTCPLAQRYTSRIKAFEEEYKAQGVQFIGINASPADTIVDVAWYQQEHGLPFPMLSDIDGSACRDLGVTRTPEALILDKDKVLRYRGRIDDQYRLGGVKPFIGRKDLVEALEDVLAGKEVRVPKTKTEGCSITYPALPNSDDTLTYHKDIAPIINEHCLDCHQTKNDDKPGLSTYEELFPIRDKIATAVLSGKMPPWPLHSEFGTFKHQKTLPYQAKNTVLQWIEGDAIAGEASQAPKATDPVPGTGFPKHSVAPFDGAVKGWAIKVPCVLLGFTMLAPLESMQCTLIRANGEEEILMAIPMPSPFTPRTLEFKTPYTLKPGDHIGLQYDTGKKNITVHACFAE